MPLIDLKTNLRSLKYGSDQRGGGSSDQPFIVTDIPEGNDVYPISGPDFIVRNGYLNYTVNTANDVVRLSKWFIGDLGFTGYLDKIEQKVEDLNWSNFGSITELVKAIGGESIRGIKFTTKQNLLEKQNPKIPDEIGRIYNPLGTIAQVGAVSSGGHFIKQGRFLRNGYYDGGRDGYFNFTNTANRNGEDRLLLLFKSKLTNSIDEFEALAGKNLYGITPFSDTVNLLSYSGGPGSILGIGKTNIRIQNPTQTKKENWSYQNVSEGEETVSINTSFTPSYVSSTPDTKGYLVPKIKRPSINWQYNFGEDPNTATFQYYTLYPNEDNANILYLSDDRLNSPTKYTRGGKPSDTIRKNDRFDLYPSGISGFRYDTDYSIRNDSYLTPFNKHPFIEWFYGIGGIGVSTTFLDNNAGYWTESEENNAKLRLGFSDADELDLNRNQTIYRGDFYDNEFHTFSYRQIVKLKDPKSISQNTSLSKIEDFRKVINDLIPEGKPKVLPSTNYSKFNRELSPEKGGYGASRTYYKFTNPSTKERVFNPNLSVSPDNTEIGVEGEDIIDFNFRLIDNLSGGVLDTTIDFRAYIEDFQDSYNATWDPFKYVGRADTFYKYSGINRTFNVTFVVPALSRADMISNYQKLNTLTWATMPDYNTVTKDKNEDGFGYMKGNFVKLTLGDYFRGMPAIINSLTFSPIMEMGFDINRYSTQDEIENPRHIEGQVIKRKDEKLFVGQLPKGIRVQAQMTIIHSFVPQRGQQLIGYEANSRNPYAIKENGIEGKDVRVSKNRNYVANKPNINNMSGDFN